MAEEEKEHRAPPAGEASAAAGETDAQAADAARRAAEEARARLAVNPWAENPDAARIPEEAEASVSSEPETLPRERPAELPEAVGEEDGAGADDDGKDGDEEPEGGETAEDEEGSMSILRHLEELRTRIIRSLIAIAVGSGVSYFYIEEIMEYLTLPTGRLYYLQPAEAFFTYIKIAIFAGFLLALPVVFYQVWKFILPALTVRERTVIGLLVPSSVLLFFTGLAFSFFLVLPAALQFFMGFSTETLQPMFTLHQYFDFVLAFILPFGAVFELPLVVIVFAKLGFISSKFLQSKQRIVIFLAFVVGAVISPTPDIFTQSMIAIPLILLYEISYLVVRFVLRR